MANSTTRKKRQRNHAAEYARRLQLAKERGYSVAVARGHAPKGTLGVKAFKTQLRKQGPGEGFIQRHRLKPGESIAHIPIRESVRPLTDEELERSMEVLNDLGLEVSLIGMTEPELIQYLYTQGYTFHEAYNIRFGYPIAA